jgi:hypothetical protein
MKLLPTVDDLQGLWKRTNLTAAGGTIDETTFVRWGQVGQFYIDIRIPENSAGADAFDRRGFAGHIKACGGLCEWHRAIDFQPPNGNRDIARVVLSGDKLQESGSPDVGSSGFYEETFERLTTGSMRKLAFGRDDRKALLLIIDDVFLYAHQRSEQLPQHKSLRDYFTTGGDATKVYDCEISMGAVDISQPQLIISHSANPARERRLLFENSSQRTQNWNVLHGAADKALRHCIPYGWLT